jgi:hypothetical protein
MFMMGGRGYMKVLIYTPSALIGGVEVINRQLVQQGVAVVLYSAESGKLVESLSIEEQASFKLDSFIQLIEFLASMILM